MVLKANFLFLKRLACDVDSVIEFGLSGAILLASMLPSRSQPVSWSQASCEPVSDQVRDSSNLSATGRKPGL